VPIIGRKDDFYEKIKKKQKEQPDKGTGNKNHSDSEQ
jgi:hypothetical protein